MTIKQDSTLHTNSEPSTADLQAEDRTTEGERPNLEHDPILSKGNTYFEAQVLSDRPFDPELHQRRIWITGAPRSDSKQFKSLNQTELQIIDSLCRHKIGKKQGECFILARMAGELRRASAIIECWGVGYDIDTGMMLEQVYDIVRRSGYFAVVYTTHSNGSQKTEFNKSHIVQWLDARGMDIEDLNDEVLTEYAITEKKWEPGVAKTISFKGVAHNESGIVVLAEHAPLPKSRVIFFFKEAFVVANEGKTQQEAIARWKQFATQFGNALQFPFDPSCIDIARVFYAPRRPEERAGKIALFEGEHVDWRRYATEEPLKAFASRAKGSKSTTKAGRDLGRWAFKNATRLQIVDLIETHAPEKLRGSAAGGKLIECANDASHSNAGNPGDKACIAISAGMGESPVFTIKCHHASCAKFTMLDHLGLMVEQGWFPREALDDEQFLAEVIDPKTGEPASPSPEAEKIEKEDNARADYKAATANLSHNSTGADIKPVLQLIYDANLDPELDLPPALKAVAEKTGRTITEIKTSYNKVANAARKKATETDDASKRNVTADGTAIFPYYGGRYDALKARQFCIDVMLERNKIKGFPRLSCIDKQVFEMSMGKDGKPKREPVSTAEFWGILNQNLTFQGHFEKHTGPYEEVPDKVVKYIHAHAHRYFPEAPQICTTPRFLPDGTLLREPGYHYDPKNGKNHFLHFGKDNPPSIPDKPTEEQVKEAVNYLRDELLKDFAFNETRPDKSQTRDPGEANAFGMLLTPYARPFFNDISPLFLTTKATPGEGATLLGKMPGLIYDGAEPKIVRCSDEDELQKELTACMRDGRTHIFFDDVTDLNNKVLHQSLTATHLSGRVLGESTIISCPNEFNWTATGVNPNVGQESARRTVFNRLNSGLENAEDREFRHPKISGLTLENFSIANRQKIVGYLLTLIQNWIVKGRKPFAKIETLDRLKNYSNWARTVGGILDACGVEGFLGHALLTSRDPQEAANREFARETIKKYGCGEASSQSFKDLLDHHIGQDSAIIQGKSDGEKRANFLKRLIRIDDKTFVFGKGADERKYMFRTKVDEATEEITYFFELVPVKTDENDGQS